MVVSNKGTVLVFCNRRIGSAADNAAAHLVLRRSFDGGRTWQATQVLFAREGWSGGIGNGVVDQSDGTIMIQYERWLHVRGMPEKDWVEGTNNCAERPLRQPVPWRRRSFGTQSEAGSRLVGSVLIAVAMLRQQNRDVLDCPTEAYTSMVRGDVAPSLLADTSVSSRLPELTSTNGTVAC